MVLYYKNWTPSGQVDAENERKREMLIKREKGSSSLLPLFNLKYLICLSSMLARLSNATVVTSNSTEKVDDRYSFMRENQLNQTIRLKSLSVESCKDSVLYSRRSIQIIEKNLIRSDSFTIHLLFLLVEKKLFLHNLIMCLRKSLAMLLLFF